MNITCLFDQTAALELLHPVTKEPIEDSEGNKAGIIYYGQHTKVYKAAAHEYNSSLSKLNSTEMEPEDKELEKVNILCAFLAALTKGFINIGNVSTENGDFSTPYDVYVNAQWFRDQIDSAVLRVEPFVKKFETN